MFIERLKNSGDYENILESIIKNAVGIKYCVSSSGMKVEHENLIANAYSLKLGETMFVYSNINCFNQPKNKQVVIDGGLISKAKDGDTHFSKTKITLFMSDFEIKMDSNTYFIFSGIDNTKLQKAYVSYMYQVFGEQYKKEFIKFKKRQKEQFASKINREIDDIFGRDE